MVHIHYIKHSNHMIDMVHIHHSAVCFRQRMYFMILLIGGEKGGTGKSTLAKNIAAYLQQQGKDIITIDSDPQGTLYRWAARRKDNPDVQPILCTQLIGSKIANELRSLATKYDVVLVDAGGQDSEALRSAMTVATHLLLPFRPKRRDLKTLVHVSQLVKLAKAVNPEMLVRGVITQCPTLPSQTQRILDAKEACQSFGIEPLQSITCNRNVYDDADENGLSVFEVTSDFKAKAEIEGIAQEFLGV